MQASTTLQTKHTPMWDIPSNGLHQNRTSSVAMTMEGRLKDSAGRQVQMGVSCRAVAPTKVGGMYVKPQLPPKPRLSGQQRRRGSSNSSESLDGNSEWLLQKPVVSMDTGSNTKDLNVNVITERDREMVGRVADRIDQRKEQHYKISHLDNSRHGVCVSPAGDDLNRRQRNSEERLQNTRSYAKVTSNCIMDHTHSTDDKQTDKTLTQRWPVIGAETEVNNNRDISNENEAKSTTSGECSTGSSSISAKAQKSLSLLEEARVKLERYTRNRKQHRKMVGTAQFRQDSTENLNIPRVAGKRKSAASWLQNNCKEVACKIG